MADWMWTELEDYEARARLVTSGAHPSEAAATQAYARRLGRFVDAAALIRSQWWGRLLPAPILRRLALWLSRLQRDS